MENIRAGYFEIEHTADWALTVFAPDLPQLLEQAALGMASLSGLVLETEPREVRELSIQGNDPEHLLVKFLTEVLYFGEEEGIGFGQFGLSLHGYSLQAHLIGAPIASQQKEIKAVTYHNLHVQPTDRGLETTIVFDV